MDMPWPIISADTDVAGPADLWQQHLPAALAHLGPRVEVHQGAVSLVVEERLVRRFGPRLANVAAATVAEQAMLTELVSLGAREPDARRQGGLTFQDDPVGLANLAFSGDACLMWGSDYPHPEGTWPDSKTSLWRQLQGVEPATARRILLDNAARIHRFPLPPQQQALHA
jgi:hypothetical protein